MGHLWGIFPSFPMGDRKPGYHGSRWYPGGLAPIWGRPSFRRFISAPGAQGARHRRGSQSFLFHQTLEEGFGISGSEYFRLILVRRPKGKASKNITSGLNVSLVGTFSRPTGLNGAVSL